MFGPLNNCYSLLVVLNDMLRVGVDPPQNNGLSGTHTNMYGILSVELQHNIAFQLVVEELLSFFEKSMKAKYWAIFPYPHSTLVLTELMSRLNFCCTSDNCGPLNGANKRPLTG